MVTGRVRIIKTGLMIEFSNARTTATTKAENTDETTTPGRRYPTTIIDIVLINIRVSMSDVMSLRVLIDFKDIIIYSFDEI